ncbi:MAG: peptide ABC transporter substrate-binding protein [Gammaproteobacteria bacterium]|nr:peptide ABC transporter substrate-binding protein [Gammaproteobacteria bacterium]
MNLRHATPVLAISALMAACADDPEPVFEAPEEENRHLNILYWQAVSIVNPYLSGGTKDIEAASMVIEPLAHYDENGGMTPVLAAEIPTLENGGVAEDLRSITWKLKTDVLWSDGTPFTAHDVAFSGAYCLDEQAGCASLASFADVTAVEAIDDHTVRITFQVAKPWPYGPFVGSLSPIIQREQFQDCLGTRAQECTEQNFGPIGTGPFKVDDFRANDVINYSANELYREPGKPWFRTATFKGGGDAASAARAVLETGEYDYAWNLQVEPEVLEQMVAAGKGQVLMGFGSQVERLMVNQTNDDSNLGDRRSLYLDGTNAHPFLSDPAVRRALSLAIDRQVLVDTGYGAAGRTTCNIVPAPVPYASVANEACKIPDPAEANRILDQAGWVRGQDGVRAKDGVRLSILYQTSTNSVRQGTQALIKQMWEAIGIETELRNIDAAVFFGADPASPDTFQKFYADVQMYTNNFQGTDPEVYMAGWVCARNPGPHNQWLGTNIPRGCSDEFDALVEELSITPPGEDRSRIGKRLNDIIVQEQFMIPLIWRAAVSARSNSLKGVRMNPWDSELWNIADWHR